jgi:D-amino-acid dehydrogenase
MGPGGGAASDVVVIGAGAVGACVALDLARRGATVTVLERGPAVGAGCSAGNAGVVGAGHVLPLASTQALREGLASLPRRHAPFALAPRPSLLPWLARFVAASTPRRHDAAAAVLRGLAVRSAALHEALGAQLDVGYVRRGFLTAYETEAGLEAGTREAAGSPAGSETLGAAALQAHAPPLAGGLAGGIHFAGEAHLDPLAFVTAVAAEVERLGGSVRPGVEVLGVRSAGGRVSALSTTRGPLPCGAVVVAAGAWSPALSRGLGTRLPVQGGKGYCVEYAGELDLRRPVYFPQRRIVLTPLAGRVRLTGMLELCGTDLRVDEVRVATIRRQAQRFVPALERLPVTRVWRGLRPCSPDGLPIVGRVPGVANAWLATGHGMWGLQLAPVTGELVGGALAGDGEDAALGDLGVTRFGGVPGLGGLAPARPGGR